MGVLAICWLIVEAILIPNGFLKWFYLSFYIHPVFLLFCQIFLWLKLLLKWIFPVFYYPFNFICVVALFIFNLFKNCVISVFPITKLTNINESIVKGQEEETESFALVPNCKENEIVAFYSFSRIASISCQQKVFQFEINYGVEEDDKIQGKDFQFSCGDENIEDDDDDEEEEEEEENFDSKEDGSVINFSSISSSESSSIDSSKVESSEYERPNNYIVESSTNEVNLNDYISSFSSSNISTPKANNTIDLNEASPPVNQALNQSPYSIFSFDSPTIQLQSNLGHENQDFDSFYNKYTERMRWFDLLNYERTSGISTILKNHQVGTPNSFESTEEVDSSLSPNTSSWDKIARKRLISSLESEFELIYVAQSCLSWEAIHHQYRKVEALAISTSQDCIFYDHPVVQEFQKFKVLLERFMEDERFEGKRIWNYVRARFSLNCLLQVPKLSGYFELAKEEIEVEGISVKEVLKAIEWCIEAFWLFVKSDNKKGWWKFKSSLWTCPPVEDPRDLELFSDITRKLQKKEVWLKDKKGKRKCWLRKVVNPLEESERKELLFTMIDMKLVSRVLELGAVSSAQLKWCQQKLDNIKFKQANIERASTSGPMFPP